VAQHLGLRAFAASDVLTFNRLKKEPHYLLGPVFTVLLSMLSTGSVPSRVCSSVPVQGAWGLTAP